MRHIHAEFGFEIVSAISEFNCDTSMHNRQRGVTKATNFGTKIAINAFLRKVNTM